MQSNFIEVSFAHGLKVQCDCCRYRYTQGWERGAVRGVITKSVTQGAVKGMHFRLDDYFLEMLEYS